MRDERPDTDYSVFDVAVQVGLPPGADELIQIKLCDALPNAQAGPIRYVSNLPSESVVEGQCNGQTVSFLKTYQGTSFSGYKVGDQLIGHRKESHAVHYEGHLSPDAQTIEGRWWIDADRASEI